MLIKLISHVHGQPSVIAGFPQLALFVVSILVSMPLHAEFSLNFNGIANQSTIATHSGENPFQHTQSPWLNTGPLDTPQIVTDPTNGKTYYHMILGSMSDGFLQEVYIQTDAGVDYSDGTYAGNHTGNRFNASNGCTTTCWDLVGSASAGNGDVVLAGAQWDRRLTDAANASRPLDADAGNATGAPNKMIMRQILSSGELYTEFLKDKYLNKPRITMAINAPDMTLQFSVDMRTVSYDDSSAVVQVFNKMWLNGADLPPNLGQFDMSKDTQQSSVSAGQYTYAPGAPGPGVGEGSNGTYTYENGSYDVSTTNWKSYFDPNWSADAAWNNPWSYPAERPQ